MQKPLLRSHRLLRTHKPCSYFHMYVHTGKCFPCRRAGHTCLPVHGIILSSLYSPLTGSFWHSRSILALLGWFSPGLSELYQQQVEAPGVFLAPARRHAARLLCDSPQKFVFHFMDHAGSGCIVNGRLPGIIIMQGHYKGRCKSCTSENAKHFLSQEVFH